MLGPSLRMKKKMRDPPPSPLGENVFPLTEFVWSLQSAHVTLNNAHIFQRERGGKRSKYCPASQE